MSPEQFQLELAALTKGNTLVIDGKDVKWWEEKYKGGFFTFLEEEEIPIKILDEGRTVFFGGGMDKKTAFEYIKSIGGNPRRKK